MSAHRTLLKAAKLALRGECWPALLSEDEMAIIQPQWGLMIATEDNVITYGGLFDPHERCLSLCFAAAMCESLNALDPRQ